MEVEERLKKLKGEGYKYYSNNDYSSAIKNFEEYLSTKQEYKLDVDLDEIQIREYLIHIYLNKDTYDFDKAISNMKIVASLNAEVAYTLGVINALGINCEPSYELAEKYFLKLGVICIHYTHYSEIQHGFPSLINQGNLYYYGINRPVNKLKALYNYAEGLFGQVRLLTERMLEKVQDPDKYIKACEKCYKHFDKFVYIIKKYCKINEPDSLNITRQYSDVTKMNYIETKKYQEEHNDNIEANFKMVFYYLLNFKFEDNETKIKKLLMTNIAHNDITSSILLYEYYNYIGDESQIIKTGLKALDMIKNKIIKIINKKLLFVKENNELFNAINELEVGMKKLKSLVKIK